MFTKIYTQKLIISQLIKLNQNSLLFNIELNEEPQQSR